MRPIFGGGKAAAVDPLKKEEPAAVSQPSNALETPLAPIDHLPLSNNSPRSVLVDAPSNPGLRAFIEEQRAAVGSARRSLASALANPIFSPSAVLAAFTSAIDALLIAVDARVRKEIGEPPVEYQLIAAGSYARRELAPFSDIDYAILVPRADASTKAYFTRYAERVGELLVAIDGEDRIHACDLMSPSGSAGDALIDTPQGMARRLAGLTEDLAARSPRDQDYLRTTLSSTRPVLGAASLYGQYSTEAAGALGKAWPALDPSSPRAELLARILRSLRDPFGLPEEVPGWLGDEAPAAKKKFVPIDPDVAIEQKRVNIKHDLMKTLQIPIFALRVLYDVAEADAPSVIDTLLQRRLIDPAFARKLIEAHDATLRLRIKNHLQLGVAEDKLAELSPSDQRALRRMVPLLFRLRQELEQLRHVDPNTFTLS